MASKNISFDTIPASIRKPGKYFEFNTKLAVRTLPSNAQKVLLIGQKTSAGTAAALAVTQIFSDSEARTLFGAGSMLYLMAKAAIKANPYLDLNCIALADAGAGVEAEATITITGPATASGGLTLYVGDQKVERMVESQMRQADGRLELTFAAGKRAYTILLNAAGPIGGHIRIAENGKPAADCDLAPRVR